MPTATQAIKWIAQYADLPGDNGGSLVWKLAGMPQYTGSAWCGATQVACAKALGLPLDPTTAIRCIYVPYVVQDAIRDGLWRASVHSQPGDWVIFDWYSHGRRDGLADHIGMVVANDPSKDYVTTIEGNAGAAANGQRHVAYHTRYRADILGTVNRQHVYTDEPMAQALTESAKPSNQDLNQWLSKATIVKLQEALGVASDGIVGPDTTKALQAALGTPKDGVISGPASQVVEKLQRTVGAEVDGILGKETGAKLTAYLDGGGKFGRTKPKPTPKPEPAPKPAPKPKGTKFPYPKGVAYAMNDGTNYTKSGVNPKDRPNIRRIQSKVGANGDGIYGAKTKAKVIAWQKAHKIKPYDGEVGAATWAAMGL